jgi:hypothetical protein
MRNFVLALLLLSTKAAHAQDAPMADALREDGKIWVVVLTLSIILAGFIAYLIRLDGRISKLEKNK